MIDYDPASLHITAVRIADERESAQKVLASAAIMQIVFHLSGRAEGGQS